MSEIIYRQMVENELVAVSVQAAESYRAAYKGLMAEAFLASLKDDYWIPILRDSLQRGDIGVVAEDDGRIVGCAVFGQSEEETAAMLHAIYVSPDYIGRGIGHGLYCSVEDQVRAMDFRILELETLSSNERAVKFYIAHGFGKTDSFSVEENGMVL